MVTSEDERSAASERATSPICGFRWRAIPAESGILTHENLMHDWCIVLECGEMVKKKRGLASFVEDASDSERVEKPSAGL
jgi:hypothetical protein